jgi:hypothetical protein
LTGGILISEECGTFVLAVASASSIEFEHPTRSQMVIQHIPQRLHPMFKLLVGEIAHKPVSFVIQSGDDLAPL